MKNTITIVILLFGIFSLCFDAEAELVSHGKESKPNPKEFFISKLKNVVDSGNLFEPNTISEILKINFQISTQSMAKFVDCSNSAGYRTSQKITISPIENNWFHALSSGTRNMKIPKQPFSNATSAHEKTDLTYGIESYVSCDKNDPVQHENFSWAVLHFSGLPGYSCITPEDIQRLLPTAKYVSATDGAYAYRYQEPGDDDRTPNLTFYFIGRATCSTNAIIEGNKY